MMKTLPPSKPENQTLMFITVYRNYKTLNSSNWLFYNTKIAIRSGLMERILLTL